ncbi:hypothetical protein CTEN210_11977 [Chaetoceros tenuissimus]|uniref:Ion transport domain-containing protein n=1 Tax=Chaetoceros tenuissimus TaxID=426638 RepID=A0AAD3H9T7_9STRA|nr:hypothetical protein CTEN210_11977 [Chaetoceros tenuissimus]
MVNLRRHNLALKAQNEAQQKKLQKAQQNKAKRAADKNTIQKKSSDINHEFKDHAIQEEESIELLEDNYQQTKLGMFLKIIDPFMIFLIVVNSIQMGLGTFHFVTSNPSLEKKFETADLAFLIIFTVEIILAMAHYLRIDRFDFTTLKFKKLFEEEQLERKQNIPWITFDALVIIFSWAFLSMSIIRAFRIFRALRLISKFESMRGIVNALAAVGYKMLMVVFLTVVLFIIFGVGCTIMFGDLYKEGLTEFDYFGSIDKSFLTLFQLMCFDNWHEPARDVMNTYWWSWIIFVLFVIFSGFVVANLVIAIICDSLITMNQQKVLDKQQKEYEEERERAKNNRRLELQSFRMPSRRDSLKSLNTTSSFKTVMDYEIELEQKLEEYLDEQEEFLDVVAQLRDILEEVMENPPSEKIKNDIVRVFESCSPLGSFVGQQSFRNFGVRRSGSSQK